MWKFIGPLLFTAVFARYEENFFSNGNIGENSQWKDAMFGIFRKQKFVCLGSIVGTTNNSAFMATAAHCVASTPISELRVQLGSVTTLNKAKEVNVDKIIFHPYYTPPSVDYDIALIKIAQSANTNGLEILEISPKEPSSTVEVATWQAENTLETMAANLENRVSCKGKLAGHVAITRKMLCVNVEGSLPDGGPIIFQTKLAGIASFAVRNAQGKFPKVYTNVANSEIFSFIEEYL